MKYSQTWSDQSEPKHSQTSVTCCNHQTWESFLLFFCYNYLPSFEAFFDVVIVLLIPQSHQNWINVFVNLIELPSHNNNSEKIPKLNIVFNYVLHSFPQRHLRNSYALHPRQKKQAIEQIVFIYKIRLSKINNNNSI